MESEVRDLRRLEGRSPLPLPVVRELASTSFEVMSPPRRPLNEHMSLRVFHRKLDGLIQPEAAQLLKELSNLKRRVARSRPRPRRQVLRTTATLRRSFRRTPGAR
jgi:hypothetical protein